MVGPVPEASATERQSDAALVQLSVDEAKRGVLSGDGGPFGAVVARDGVVIAVGHNRVLETNDPTAHAEMVAIRAASAKLGKWNLSDCTLYASCHPCPMCFTATHWSKIPKCFFAATPEDAAGVGFDDKYLYDAIRGETEVVKLEMTHVDTKDKLKPFHTFQDLLNNGKSSLY